MPCASRYIVRLAATLGLALGAMRGEPSRAQTPVAFLAVPRTEGFFRTQSVSEWDAQGDTRGGGVRVYQPAAQLVVRGDDGTERVLVSANAVDFSVCHDGRTLLAAIVVDGQADIFRVDSTTGAQERLTNTPSWEVQPVECGDGRIAFLSDRDGWQNPDEYYRAFTIYRMNADGREQERIWHCGFGGVFGLSCGPDGRLYFSSGENQGGRPGRGNNWGIWSINPDGSDFRPEISALGDNQFEEPYDWPCISSHGSLLAAKYYDTRIYGKLDVCPPITTAQSQSSSSAAGPPTHFANAVWAKNPPVRNGYRNGGEASHQFGHQRRGVYSLFDWANDDDIEARGSRNQHVGHVSHPAAIPGNGCFVTWTGDEGDDKMDLGVYAVDDIAKVSMDPSDMRRVVDEPNRHEWMGKLLVTHQAIYGIDKPPTPTAKLDDKLPIGSPFGVVGSSSLDWPEVSNGNPDISKVAAVSTPLDGEFLRILAFVPTMNVGWYGSFAGVRNNMPWMEERLGWEGFQSAINERTGFYEQLIPIKKYRGPQGELHLGPNPPAGYALITRKDGRPDTSFACELPANQAWTFQVLNAKKEAILTARTWHQVAPGESRTDCAGCHSHENPDLVAFADTLAGSAEYPRQRLDKVKTVIYGRDVAPNIPGVERAPWLTSGGPQPYGSGGQTFDDNPEWTEAQRELYRAWQDTGFLAEAPYSNDGPNKGKYAAPPVGPYDDTLAPTLTIKRTEQATYVGVFDPHSGITGLGIAADGVDVLDKFQFYPDDHVFVGPAFPDATIEAMATDGNGNATRLSRRPVEPREQARPGEQHEYTKSKSAEPTALTGS